MQPKPGERFVINPNSKDFTNQTVYWTDYTGKEYELREDLFLAEYVCIASEGDVWPEGDYIFYVYRKYNDSNDYYGPYSSFSTGKNEWEIRSKQYFISCSAAKQAPKNSLFPHKCTICKQDAYIGGLNNCECSNALCSFYHLNPRY
jgi:hypothetical protein